MSAKKEKQSHLFVDSDFGSTHDEIMTLLTKTWFEIVKKAKSITPTEHPTDFQLEPAIGKYHIVFPDAIGITEDTEDRENFHNYYIFEVKPKIDSFGFVLRQLNFYVKIITETFHERYSRYQLDGSFLITPDMRFNELFAEHNRFKRPEERILLIKPKDLTILLEARGIKNEVKAVVK